MSCLSCIHSSLGTVETAAFVSRVPCNITILTTSMTTFPTTWVQPSIDALFSLARSFQTHSNFSLAPSVDHSPSTSVRHHRTSIHQNRHLRYQDSGVYPAIVCPAFDRPVVRKLRSNPYICTAVSTTIGLLLTLKKGPNLAPTDSTSRRYLHTNARNTRYLMPDSLFNPSSDVTRVSSRF